MSVVSSKLSLFALVVLIAAATRLSASDYLLSFPTGDRPWSDWRKSQYVCSQGFVCTGSSGNVWLGMRQWITPEQRLNLDSAGVSLVWMFDQDGIAYYQMRVINGMEAILSWLKEQSNFVNIFPMKWEEKVDMSWYDSISSDQKTMVVLWDEARVTDTPLSNHQDVESADGSDSSQYWLVVIGKYEIEQLARSEMVQSVQRWDEPQPLNYDSRVLTGLSMLQSSLDSRLQGLPVGATPVYGWLSGIPYTGSGVKVGLSEKVCKHTGLMSITSGLWQPRSAGTVQWIDCNASVEHGVHVAGIIAGNGYGSEQYVEDPKPHFGYRGVAPEALIVNQLSYGATGANKQNVANRSFTEGGVGYYNSTSQLIDEFLSNHSNIPAIVVNAAANNGYQAQYGQAKGYYSM